MFVLKDDIPNPSKSSRLHGGRKLLVQNSTFYFRRLDFEGTRIFYASSQSPSETQLVLVYGCSCVTQKLNQQRFTQLWATEKGWFGSPDTRVAESEVKMSDLSEISDSDLSKISDSLT